jgi:hypothetical protein
MQSIVDIGNHLSINQLGQLGKPVKKSGGRKLKIVKISDLTLFAVKKMVLSMSLVTRHYSPTVPVSRHLQSLSRFGVQCQ